MKISYAKTSIHTITKSIYKCLCALVVTTLMASCMNDEEIVTTPECAITSFSVNSIKSMVTIKKYDSSGNATDTTVAKTIGGSDIHFNIDQVKGIISTVDSLPNWVDLTRVVPNFTGYGTVFTKVKVNEDSLYYAVASGTDSLDFSKPLELVSIATNGYSTKTYTVYMHKATANIDTLEWKQPQSDLQISKVGRVFSNDGVVTLFGRNAEGKAICSTTQNGSLWNTATMADDKVIDINSVVTFKGEFYALDAEGNINKSTNGSSWTIACDQKAERLLAADNYYMYIYDGQAILGTADLNEWTEQGNEKLALLPETFANYVHYSLKSNENIQVAIMTGQSSASKSNSVVWHKLSSLDTDVNQKWSYIDISIDNSFTLPKLENLSTTYYNGSLYAIGVKDGKYGSIYRSDDNGLSWRPLSSKYPVPANLDPVNGNAAIMTVGSQLWIVQDNGSVWQGSIR